MNIQRRGLPGIERQVPAAVVRGGGQIKKTGAGIGIEHHQHVHVVGGSAGFLSGTVHDAHQPFARRVPTGVEPAGAVPVNIAKLVIVQIVTSEKGGPAEDRMGLAQGNDLPGKTENIGVLFPKTPIVPGNLVVLAVGIVVALLSPPELVAAQEHRCALRQHQGGQKVFDLPGAGRFDMTIVGWAFDAVVITRVVMAAVLVVLAVGLVVFGVIADQVVHGKAVMGGDKIDAIVGRAAIGIVQVGAAGQAGRQRAGQAGVAPPKTAKVVAILVVPLGPAPARKPPHLVAPHVPRLGN